MARIQITDQARPVSKLFGMPIGNFIARFGALFGLLILVIFLSIMSPVFLTSNNLSNIARQATVNALLSIGLLLAIITAGIDLSVGSAFISFYSLGERVSRLVFVAEGNAPAC